MVNHDEVFDALADGQRRRLLLQLRSGPQRVPQPSGVSRTVAEANENLLQRHLSSSRTIAGADEYSLSMHHVHLPKLTAYGFVEWDRDDDLVTQGHRFDELTPHLDLLVEQQDDLRSNVPLVTYRR
ncbi:DUF7344 domain-containing protein [Halopiger goleimassiliensis]|uniref:DUF7344 domain-containing protein n=1 Tax=Halopiger goleimassiliensis TaxID=1293048 RepID=UPI000677E281|nr:hypothetical protein [Halopiger goleimassiliensis]